VNLDKGEAQLATTSVFGGVTDPALKADVSDLSLATYQVSELLTVEDITGEAEGDAIGSAVPTGTTELNITYNDDTALVDISLGGSKKEYSIGSSTYETNTSVINLIYATGQKTFSNSTTVDEFNSEGEQVGDVLSDSQKQDTTLSWLYRKDLIIISYPTWGGEQINHDPEFKTYFEPNPQPTESDDTEHEDTEPTDTEPTDTEPTDIEPTETPVFTIPLVFMALFITYTLFRKKNRS